MKINKNRFRLKYLLVIIILAVFSQLLCKISLLVCPNYLIEDDIISSDAFRSMNINFENISKLNEFAKQNNMSTGELSAIYFCDNYNELSDENLSSLKSIYSYKGIQLKILKYVYEIKQKEKFEKLKNKYEAVLNDLRYFPVAQNEGDLADVYTVSYINSWFSPRSYAGARRHEGTDIMADENKRGIYPVVSVSNGVVEKIGWLKLGGYRIGIRSESKVYFYYAHLDSYSKEYNVGDKIKAGEIIGYMGDSGYGAEGTIGKFDVHLHFGMYIEDYDGNEMSINPYYLLQGLQNNKKVVYFQ